MIEESLIVQATRSIEDDYEDFYLQLVFNPNHLESGPRVCFYAVEDEDENEELFFLPLKDFMELAQRARTIWGPLQDSSQEATQDE